MSSATKHNVFTIADAQEADFSAIQQIYAPYVMDTTVSLEEVPPDVEEMKARWQKSCEAGLPYIVAKIDGIIAGYAYAFPYRPRTAYRFTVEESVYIAKGFKNTGIGYKLLSELITQCQEKGYKQMIAVIAGTDNIASIKLHEKLGFRQAGVFQKVGFKFGKWVDTILMQKELQP